MADTPQQNSLAAEFERMEEKISIIEHNFKELRERISRLELYNYKLQTNFIDLARKDTFSAIAKKS